MIKIIIIVLGIFAFLLLFFWQGIAQSKKPNGQLGAFMMNMWNKIYSQLFLWALSQLSLNTDDIVLDIGIGAGISTSFLADRISSGKIYGVDYSTLAVKEASVNNQSYIDNGKVIIQQANVMELPFEDNFFTLVTAFQTHFHWEDFEKGLSEIYRVLQPQGRLVLACEYAKIAYYMKDFTSEKYSTSFFEQQGYQNISIDKSERWILFSMIK